MPLNPKKAAATLLLLLLLPVAVGCSGAAEQTPEGLTTVDYASFNGPSGLPAKFGAQKGFFAEAGLEVNFVEAQDPVGLVSSGDVDIADSDTTSAIVAAGRSAPIRIVSSMYRTRGPFYLVGTPEVNRVEDLRGKKVGIGRRGSGMEVYTRYILRAHGLEESDVTLVANGSYQPAYASLESRQVDATIIHEPFVSLAESQGVGRLLAKGWDYLPTFHTGVEITNDAFARDDPEVVERFLTAYFRSAVYAKEHPEEFLAFAASQLTVPEQVQQAALTREEPIWDNDPRVDLDAVRDTQEIQREFGFQDTVYDPTEIVDTSFLPTPQEIAAGRPG